MLRTTAGRLVTSRPTSLGLAATALQSSTRQIPATQRSLSFFPWRKRIDPTLPVYFAKTTSTKGPNVRWQPRWRKLRYAVMTLAVYYALWQIYMSVVLDPLLDWAETEWESLSEKERQELEEEADDEDAEPLLFLPFPFTTKEVTQMPYKSTDPEWTAFLKVNKNLQLQKEMKIKLAEGIRKSFEKNALTVRLMGGKPTKVRKIWLDILYPSRPPPKHYVSGLIVDWDGLFWGDRSIDSMAAHKLNSVVYPKAVALATWTFLNVLVQNTQQSISKMLGIGSSPPQQETSWQSVILERGKDHRPGALGTGHSSPPQVIHSPGQGTQSPANPNSNSSQLPPPPPPPDLLDFLKKPLGPDSPASAGVLMAFQAASLTLVRNWKPTQQPPTRGCIRVDGLVELEGPSSIMVLYVLGWYEPQANKFINVQTKIKHVVARQQRPLR